MTTRWQYEDAAGVTREGIVEKTSDRGGTDVTYFFRRDDGTLDVVSGSRLRTARIVTWAKAGGVLPGDGGVLPRRQEKLVSAHKPGGNDP